METTYAGAFLPHPCPGGTGTRSIPQNPEKTFCVHALPAVAVVGRCAMQTVRISPSLLDATATGHAMEAADSLAWKAWDSMV